jgi:hypothetical protein
MARFIADRDRLVKIYRDLETGVLEQQIHTYGMEDVLKWRLRGPCCARVTKIPAIDASRAAAVKLTRHCMYTDIESGEVLSTSHT